MRGEVNRGRRSTGPGGTRLLVASLCLSLLASGCASVDTSLDALSFYLEENIPHTHGPAPRPPAPARNTVSPQRSARVRGVLLVGLAVRPEVPPPPAVKPGLPLSAPRPEVSPPALAGRTEHPWVHQVLPSSRGNDAHVLREAVAGVMRVERTVRRGQVSMPGVVRGRESVSPRPFVTASSLTSGLSRSSGGVPPGQVLARGAPGVSRGLEYARGPGVPSPEGGGGRARQLVSGGAAGRRGSAHAGGFGLLPPGGALAIRVKGATGAGPPRPEHSYAFARRGRLTRPSPGAGTLVGVPLVGQAGQYHERVRDGGERHARVHHPDHRVHRPRGDHAVNRARRALVGLASLGTSAPSGSGGPEPARAQHLEDRGGGRSGRALPRQGGRGVEHHSSAGTS
ncbi:hypothetical protein CYFUS_001208 [Cystobacter fuscus]|uniref:Lipoprotein n=1 Tax=Cystobacter fuscus TaxID=43 RepID=A0A250IVM9_9BACT|nr:hypothetical protein CYFUS_001208 [Cystobacter fuscus]